MTGAERRRSPRTTLERYAYINIEPNNGGIVLNVSDGGLCFHSFDPVKRNEKVRFWFWDNNRRIDADAELAWMDETQKGGLRFTVLSADAREHLRNWMNQPGTVAVAAAASPGQTVAAPVREFPRPAPVPAEPRPVPVAGGTPADPVPQVKILLPLKSFSGGLAVGLMLTAVVTTVFLFQIYRAQIGASLIRLGERFGAKAEAGNQGVLPPAEPPILPPKAVAVSSSPAPSALAEKPVPQNAPAAEKPQVPPPVPVVAAVAAYTVSTNPPKSPAAASPAPTGSSTPPMIPFSQGRVPDDLVRPSSPTLVAASQPAPPPATPPGPEVAEESKTANPDAVSEMFFEVGAFKDKRQAHNATDKLAQLGFPTSTVQKTHLWSNAYHVLVGPYDDNNEASETRQDLVTRGFKPRPFERGSRDLTFRSGLQLNGTQMPVGIYTVSWESYASDASVKLVRENSVVTTVTGRWVKRDVKYDADAYMYRKNPNGSKTLLEIRFAGMRQALDLSPVGSTRTTR